MAFQNKFMPHLFFYFCFFIYHNMPSLVFATNRTLFICKGSSANIRNNNEGAKTWSVPRSLMTSNVPALFSLVENPNELSCSSERISTETLDLLILQAVEGSNYPTIQFTRNGFLKNGSDSNAIFRHPGKFCIAKLTNKIVELNYCDLLCTRNEPCIRKCCAMDKFYSPVPAGKSSCTANNQVTFNPIFYNNVYDETTELNLSSSFGRYEPTFYIRTWKIEQWKNSCPSEIKGPSYNEYLYHRSPNRALATNNPSNERFRVTTSGELSVWSFEAREWLLERGPWCIDESPNGARSVLIKCQMGPQIQGAPQYYGIINIITSFFALLTFVVHILLWEKQNIHSWTIMSFSISLFIFFLFLGIAHLISYIDGFVKTGFCKGIATVVHFFLISTFCWLTIISLDLYWTFRDIMVSKSGGIKRYGLYSVLGWGVPIIVIIISWTLELNYGPNDHSTLKVPQYGIRNCYITEYAMTQYAYGPCSVLFILNLTFFGLTLHKLVEYKKSTRFAREDSKQDRQSFVLFVKLFFVTGVLWIIEFCGWYLEHGEATWYWMILDLGNSLQPVTLFIIFVLKIDVLKSLQEKYPCLEPATQPLIKCLKYFDRKCNSLARKANNISTSSTKSGKSSSYATETTNCETSF